MGIFDDFVDSVSDALDTAGDVISGTAEFATYVVKETAGLASDIADTTKRELFEPAYDSVKEFAEENPVTTTVIATAATAALGGLAAPTIATALGKAGFLGAASTGTAINSLSGAALTNASLAKCGGGALAKGGFGMVGGKSAFGLAGGALGGTSAASMTSSENQSSVQTKDESVQSTVVNATTLNFSSSIRGFFSFFDADETTNTKEKTETAEKTVCAVVSRR